VRSADEEVSITQSFSDSNLNSSACSSDGDLYTVPAGKDLVVLYLGAQVVGSDGNSVTGEINESDARNATVLPLVFQQPVGIGFEGRVQSSASEAIHFVVRSGQTLHAFALVERSNADDLFSCQLTVDLGGYLKPAA